MLLDTKTEAKVRRYYELGRYVHRQSQTNPLSVIKPIPWQAQIDEALDDGYKEVWVVGANRSAKTWGGSRTVAKLVQGKAGWYDYRGGPGVVWCMAISHAESKLTQRPLIRTMIAPSLLPMPRQGAIPGATYSQKAQWNDEGSDHESVLRLDNGWMIVFKASTQGERRAQSAAVDLIWFDEEPDAAVYDEAYTRTTSTRGRIVITFTPTRGLTWKDAHKKVYLPWLAYKKKHPKAKWGPIDQDVYVITPAVTDNPFVPPEEIERAKRKWAHRPQLLRVKLYGDWIDTSEEAIINTDKIAYWSTERPPKVWRRTTAWLDTNHSEDERACDWCLSVASSDEHGGRYLREQIGGKHPTRVKIEMIIRTLSKFGFPRTWTQRVPGDTAFRDHLNMVLVSKGYPACIRIWPEKGEKMVGKEERAEMFSDDVDAGRVYVLREHTHFVEQAGTFPTEGADNDWFDSGMGALMQLQEAPMDQAYEEAVEQQTTRSGQDDVPYDQKDYEDWQWSGDDVVNEPE